MPNIFQCLLIPEVKQVKLRFLKTQRLATVGGDAISLTLQNPLAGDTLLRDCLLTWPDLFLNGLTQLVLYVELLLLPLIFIKKLCFVMWFLMLMIQCDFLILLNVSDLICVMLRIHLYAFDPTKGIWCDRKVVPIG